MKQKMTKEERREFNQKIKKMKRMNKLWATNEMSYVFFLPLLINSIGQIVCLVKQNYYGWFHYWFIWSIPVAFLFVWGFLRFPKFKEYIEYAESFGEGIVDRALAQLGKDVKLQAFELQPTHFWGFACSALCSSELLKKHRTSLYTILDKENVDMYGKKMESTNIVVHSVIMILDGCFYSYREESVIAKTKPKYFKPAIIMNKCPMDDMFMLTYAQYFYEHKTPTNLLFWFRNPKTSEIAEIGMFPEYSQDYVTINKLAIWFFENYADIMHKNIEKHRDVAPYSAMELFDDVLEKNIKTFGDIVYPKIAAEKRHTRYRKEIKAIIKQIRAESEKLYGFGPDELIEAEELKRRGKLGAEYKNKRLLEIKNEKPYLFENLDDFMDIREIAYMKEDEKRKAKEAAKKEFEENEKRQMEKIQQWHKDNPGKSWFATKIIEQREREEQERKEREKRGY